MISFENRQEKSCSLNVVCFRFQAPYVQKICKKFDFFTRKKEREDQRCMNAYEIKPAYISTLQVDLRGADIVEYTNCIRNAQKSR